MQQVRKGTISLWQLQANELADEQAKNRSSRGIAQQTCTLTVPVDRANAGHTDFVHRWFVIGGESQFFQRACIHVSATRVRY